MQVVVGSGVESSDESVSDKRVQGSHLFVCQAECPKLPSVEPSFEGIPDRHR